MKKVALISPGKNPEYSIQEPLTLGFLASYLEKNGAEVKIIDELAGQNVKKELKNFSPDLCGITATTPVADDAYRVASVCRDMGIKTIMGGVHASVIPEEALQHTDVVVKGEGEIALLDIINDKNKGRVVSRPYIKNVDDVPPPSRHLMDMSFYMRSKDRHQGTYLQFVPLHTKVGELITSRGCPYSCLFCHNTWRGTPYRANSVERVIEEIESLIEVYGIEALFFIEDNFFVNKERVKKICKILIRKKVDLIWGGNSRVDNIDIETLKLAKKAGCKQITFGFESGSQRILDILNKRTTIQQNRNAIKVCKKMGFLVNGTFIIGSPTETMKDIGMTKKFIMENKMDGAGICIATPFPGTGLWKWCEQNNKIPDNLKWSEFTYTKVPIDMCDDITPDKLKNLRDELQDLTNPSGDLLVTSIARTFLKDPVGSTGKLIRKPSKIISIVKRIKL